MPNHNENDPRRGDLRSFGRRRGRALSAHQQQLLDQLLPKLVLDIDSVGPESCGLAFGDDAGEMWLEIGFGGGEHLIWQAANNPGVAIIGCEPFVDGIVKVLSALDKHGPAHGPGHGLANIRIYGDDARALLRWLPEAVIARAFILFPDPWPKKKHHKRRLISGPTLDLLARVMKPGAQLRIASDIADYVRAIMLAIHTHAAFDWPAAGPCDWRKRPDDWPQTRYEQKAMREGRRCYYFRFRRVAGDSVAGD